jgi:hypothetical protein
MFRNTLCCSAAQSNAYLTNSQIPLSKISRKQWTTHSEILHRRGLTSHIQLIREEGKQILNRMTKALNFKLEPYCHNIIPRSYLKASSSWKLYFVTKQELLKQETSQHAPTRSKGKKPELRSWYRKLNGQATQQLRSGIFQQREPRCENSRHMGSFQGYTPVGHTIP